MNFETFTHRISQYFFSGTGFYFSLLKPFRQTFQLNVLVLEAFVVPMSEQFFFYGFCQDSTRSCNVMELS